MQPVIHNQKKCNHHKSKPYSYKNTMAQELAPSQPMFTDYKSKESLTKPSPQRDHQMDSPHQDPLLDPPPGPPLDPPQH